MQAWVAERFPQQTRDSDFVYRQATRAKSLDALRGLLPAASLSNIGIYGTGQSYEQLLLRMRAHPLPEARHYADMMLDGAAQGHPFVPAARRRGRAGRGVVRVPRVDPGRDRPAGGAPVARPTGPRRRPLPTTGSRRR